MNPFFNWLKDSGTLAMLVLVSTVAAIIAAIAGVVAVIYSKGAPTKEDLARVEGNTAHLEEVRAAIASLESRSKRQEDDTVLADRALSVPIIASGQGDNTEPFLRLNIRTRPERQNVSFTRVELCNTRGNVSGEVECQSSPHDRSWFFTEVPSQLVAKWRSDGRLDRGFTTEHVLRVWILFDGETRETYRDVPVTLTQAQRVSIDNSRSLIPVNRIEGAV